MRKTSTRGIVLAIVSVLAMAGAAFAYWTVSGSGNSQATTGTAVQISVNQTGGAITGLAPGLPAQTLSGNFDNANAGPVYVGSVAATVVGTNITGCNATNYTIGGSAPVGVEVASGSGVGSWSGLTIAFNNKPGTNQNICQGAIVNIAYTSN